MDQISAHPIIAILVTLLASSTGTFFLSRFFMSKKDAADVATSLFNALSAQVTALSARVESLQHTVDDWRTKYFQLLEECADLKIECADLKHENGRLKAEINLINPKPALYREPSNSAV
jgi:cell shape-determining protein MreC